MLDKATFLASVKFEVAVIKHLAAQLAPAQLDYRPTPAQRSTIELLRYLTIIASGSAGYALTGSWDHWEGLEKRAAAVDLGSFGKAMDRQYRALEKALAGHTDAKLRRQRAKTMAGRETSLGHCLVEMPLKMLTAYRMQLFLYAKGAGLAHLGTSDLWMGRAPKATKKTAAAG
jgi:hypothetical protein